MTPEQNAAQWRHYNQTSAEWWERRAQRIKAGVVRLTRSQNPTTELRKAERRAAEYRAKLEATE
jgi:hypothetical protein